MHITRHVKTVAASGLALATATTLLAAPKPASAMTSCFYPASLPGQPAVDVVRLPSVGVDFGTRGLDSSNDPTCGGTVTWNISSNTIRPEIRGDLIQKNNLGVTARVLVSYYDVHDTKLGSSWTDGAHTATSNLDTVPVTIDAYADPLIYRVDVKTQVQQSSGAWTDKAVASVYIGSANKAADAATISAPSYDFGGSGGLASGAPADAGSIWWDLSNNQLRASVLGTLYFTTQPGATARLHFKTFDVHGTQLQDWGMPPRSPSTPNGTDSFAQNYGTAANDYIYRAELSLEVLIDPVNDIWQTVGTPVTAYI